MATVIKKRANAPFFIALLVKNDVSKHLQTANKAINKEEVGK